MAAAPGAGPAGHALRGDMLIDARRPEDAARAYATARAATPSSLLVLREADAWRAADKPDEAAATLRTWLNTRPNDDAVQLAMSQLDIVAGRVADATRRLSELVVRRPDDSVALNNLAWLLGEQQGEGAASRAIALAERAYFLAPNADTADTLGWIHVRHGEPTLGVPLLRQALSSNVADPGITYRLAAALQATGARAEALALLAPALQTTTPFGERAAAERLLRDLRAPR